MQYTIETAEENRVRVCVTGWNAEARDLPGLKQLLMKCHQEGKNHQLLDVSECAELDETGFSALLIANRLCRNSGGSFVLRGVQESLWRCIQYYKLEAAFMIQE